MLNEKRAKQIRYFSISIILYMCAAFIWWTVLLRQSVEQYYDLKLEMVQYLNLDEPGKDQAVIEIQKKLDKRKKMIFGEALFLCLTLSIGFGLVYASYRRALEASRNQTNFLLSITHEFKTPIASVSLILETILKRKLNKEQQQRLGNDAMRETKRLNSLVNNLLLSARLDSKYSPYQESLNLCEICETIVDEYQYKHPKSSISIHCNKDLPTVFADKEGMTAVIYNLLGNALKYCEGNPVINISISQVNNKLELRVSDNGIGIADTEKKKVFKRFYRSGNESTRKTKGTGLGLFIVKEIIEAHKGKIRLENNSPSGSVFIISLPIQ
jgi:signal transduction histidine kinase